MTKLSNFLADHFSTDFRENVPPDIWKSAVESTHRILTNPDQFPSADFTYLDKLSSELFEAGGFHMSAREGESA